MFLSAFRHACRTDIYVSNKKQRGGVDTAPLRHPRPWDTPGGDDPLPAHAGIRWKSVLGLLVPLVLKLLILVVLVLILVILVLILVILVLIFLILVLVLIAVLVVLVVLVLIAILILHGF